MPNNFFIDLLVSVFDFLRGAFLLSVVIFFLFLIGYFFSRKILEKKFNLSWMQKTFLSSFFVFVLLLLVFFVWPVIEAFLAVDLGVVPEPLKMTLPEFFYLIVSLLVKLIVASFIFSLLVLPLAFFGVFVFDFISKRFNWNTFINFFLACFASTILGYFLVLFLFPWIIAGALYLVYFG